MCARVCQTQLALQGFEDGIINCHPLAEYVAEIYDKLYFEEVCIVWLIPGILLAAGRGLSAVLSAADCFTSFRTSTAVSVCSL